ncbi:MAG: peptidyl-prolyl cis-trans isomerase [Ignavibacteriaceae bacterium]
MNKILTLIITIALANNLFTQPDENKVIAKVGSDEITADVFLERYELTPQVNAAVPGIEESLKREVLYSIIAEKLWALEAEEMGLSNSELIRTTYKAIEKMYVRDALYREEVLSKVKISDEYLNEAFRRNSRILKLHYLFSDNKKVINQLYTSLKEGALFDSLFSLRPESALQEEPYLVNYGQMEKEVEDSLYNLKVGNFTMPVKAPNGWYIFKLIATEEKIIQDSDQAEAEQKNVLKIARATITDSIYKDYYSKFFFYIDAKTNGELFTDFSNKVVKIFEEKSITEDVTSKQKFYLSSEDLYKIEAEFGPEKLNDEFVILEDQPLTLDDFLQELSFEKFSVDTVYSELIKRKLNVFVKRFIEHELLAREGYKRGLQNLPEVMRELNMWRSYYLSDALRTKVADDIQVSDEEIRNYFSEKNKGETSEIEVKIIELLTNDLDVIKDVLEKLDGGGDFRELAKDYTIREEAKNNNGELGFFPVNEYGKIGEIAATMNIGDMYGPLAVPEGYSLFELIDKKENHFSDLSFDKNKEKIRLELRYKKFSDEIIRKTVELANKFGVNINDQVINSLEVLNTTSVVYRYFGFGGRMLAVPMTGPNYLWVKPWQEQQELNP